MGNNMDASFENNVLEDFWTRLDGRGSHAESGATKELDAQSLQDGTDARLEPSDRIEALKRGFIDDRRPHSDSNQDAPRRQPPSGGKPRHARINWRIL